MAESIMLKDVRLAFPDVHKATEYQGDGNFKYRAALIVAPGSAADKTILDAINRVAKDAFKDKAGAILKAAAAKGSQGFCYTDGSVKEYDGYEGNMILASTRAQDKGRPGVYDRDKSPLSESDGKPYAGCYVNAKVELWAQDNTFGKSVRCTLVSLQFLRDGDAFSSGSKPSEDDFDALDDGAAADDLV